MNNNIIDSSYSSGPDEPIFSKPPWRKLLWVQQPYADNYVHSSFLSQLKRNSNVQPYSFSTLFSSSSTVLLHLSTIVIFGSVFVGIYNLDWNPGWFAVGGTVFSAIGFIVWQILRDFRDIGATITTFKSFILILFCILALSPVLKSLTRSTSSDSIWSISCWLCVANIIFHDYSPSTGSEAKFMLSTNLAMASAIVLASRLPTTSAVFFFIVFSIELFGLLPPFALWVRQSSKNSHWALLLILIVLSDTSLHAIGGVWAVAVWLAIQLILMLLFPFWLLGLQKYKNEIQGPWDPAKPVIKSSH